MPEDLKAEHEQPKNLETTESKEVEPATQENAPEKPKTALVQSADQKVTALVRRFESAKKDARNLSLIRERLGIENQGSTPNPETDLAEIQAEVISLEEEKKRTLKEYGADTFPEGVSVAANEDGSEQKTKAPKIEKFEKDLKRTEEEQKKMRQELVDQWKERAVTSFSKTLKNGWNTRNAINLELVVALLKANLPKLIDGKTKDFVDGKTDQLPIYVWMHHKGSSLLDIFAGRPQQIKEVTLEMDDQTFTVVDAKEIQKKEKEQGVNTNKIDQNKKTEEPKPETEPTTEESDQGGIQKAP